MDKEKKKISIVGHTAITCRSFKECILAFLGEYVEAVSWCSLDSQLPPAAVKDADLYVVATTDAYELVRKFCSADKPVFIGERILSVQALNKLLALDENAKTYVVGTNYETTSNTIKILQELGFNQLNLMPCFPGMAEEIKPEIDTAITPGLWYLIPPHIKNVIDVGAKEMALSTFVQIAEVLELPVTVLNRIPNFYIKTILTNTKQISVISEQNQLLNNQLEAIINTLQEALVAIDKNNKVIVYNQAAEKIFHLPSDKALGEDWQNILPESLLTASLLANTESTNKIDFIDGQHYFVNVRGIFDNEEHIHGVVGTFQPVKKIEELETKVRSELKSQVNSAKYSFQDIKGSSTSLRKAVTLAAKFAATDMTVLLQGESGTGKELFAQAIHNQSPRRQQPFLAVNFAAIPDNLVESELFGYAGGAFTGAKKEGKVGLFEEAHLGTIFLDEIGSATQEVQRRLLRVLEEYEIRRIGSNQNIPIDVRIIAATNIDLEELVKQKVFRDDLYYRLCTLPIYIPALRERKTDIAYLANSFAGKFSPAFVFQPELLQKLIAYDWPGNIRELQNVVKYLCSVTTSGKAAKIEDLPPYLLRKICAGSEEALTAEQKELSAAAVPEQFRQPQVQQVIKLLMAKIKEHTSLAKGVGFTLLLASVRAAFPDISEYYVRKWLKNLHQFGYIQTGKTKQGSVLTAKGEELLLAWQSQAAE